MCAMYMLFKIGTVCLRVVDPHFIFDRIGVRTIRPHMCLILPEDIVLALKQVLSFYTIPFITTLLIWGHMQINYTSGSTIDLEKQGVVIIKGFVIIVKNILPPPLCTLHHEPIVGVIYHLFSKIIVETSLGLRRPSDALVCQPDINQTHRKKR